MKRIFALLFLPVFASAAHAGEVDGAMKELSSKIIASYQKLPDAKRRKYVAVLDFQNRSMLATRNNLGVAFSEILAQHLLRYRDRLRVVERKQLESIIREKELKMTGIVEGGDASSYGEVLGADFLIMGSVFDAGDKVRVNVRMVETGKSEVLLNESVSIDRSAFVKQAKRYVKVTHTVSAGYQYQTLDDYTVHNVYVMYSYDFFLGLALNFQLFYGYSDTNKAVDKYSQSGFQAVDKYKISFQQFGMNVLFSKKLDLFWGLGLNPYAGPSLLYYMDKTVLYERTYDGIDDLDNKVTINPSYMLFGLRGGINLEYRFSMNYKIFVGGEYQYFPDLKVKKQVTYKTPPPPVVRTLLWDDKIKLTGYSITAGAAYSF